jgi:hypothetical protein
MPRLIDAGEDPRSVALTLVSTARRYRNFAKLAGRC